MHTLPEGVVLGRDAALVSDEVAEVGQGEAVPEPNRVVAPATYAPLPPPPPDHRSLAWLACGPGWGPEPTSVPCIPPDLLHMSHLMYTVPEARRSTPIYMRAHESLQGYLIKSFLTKKNC